ncbi:MAG: SEC-C metal-binding domain-containing protein [Thermoleophilaceae bacterium]
MPVVEDLLRPYVEARSVGEAERALDALDALADGEPAPGLELGDRYDALAEEAANEDAFETAARLERKAIELGSRHPVLAREMLGWYLLKAGSVSEGERVFTELRDERPDDVEVLITMGHARSDSGLQDDALAAFDQAVTVAKHGGDQGELDRARVERRAEREHVGLPVDADDRAAPRPQPIFRETIEWALAWFPPDQLGSALARWPELAGELGDPTAYAQSVEGHLRLLHRETGRRPSIAPLDVDEFSDWAASEGYDPDSGATRSQFAAELVRTGDSIAWPPGRNDPCWCRSGRKYKRCCGAG